MPVSDYQLVSAWQEVLRLSKLEAGQTVTILTSTATHPQNLRCAAIAVQSLGAVMNRLDLPPVNAEKALSRDSLAYLGTTPLTGNKAAIACLKESDLVLDLMTLLFSPEQIDILKSGTKILLAVEPPEVLVRTVPTEADRKRVKTAAARIEAAKEMTVVSDAGTDLRCPIGEFPPTAEYAFVDEAGRWDHWPSGFAFTFPNEGQATGRIVIDKGDILLPQKSYTTDQIILTVENGYATKIEGGVDAELLREYMASFNDPEGYAISHIGWGLQPRCYWSTLGLYDKEQTIGMDARAYEGNFLFSLGPNNEGGGSRTTACHIDIPLRNCTVSLDGEEVVRNGKVLDGGVK
ncbi:MAG TPA: 2,5-dihydroxypyridine 5,6-dioxygenase [Pusillimonas sp.]|jgi:2,5-dihydroxypyridine 5,6-dioxygenase|nr:2,5-dihydroxypyridine 5,6-dioxygenase [Pusillimonas sp.]MBC42124.1 2,5-dihydroxypyridine 5,6-dioxygenase [Pusillimonas sp.]HBT34421.1 2,5-dihydroxypyridine 5,6-dioxygenase [Pusillimonas sp.]HCP76385.1 2,5-dihydroxypyridine 5,6-dioxygenase [Pusillimonas sp.]|tara:strand:+ start:89375 stop:90418 length:1044 start_codon:yes stop_codon:yes gene_type:complete